MKSHTVELKNRRQCFWNVRLSPEVVKALQAQTRKSPFGDGISACFV